MALPIVYLLINGMLQSSPFNPRSLVRKIAYGARSQNQGEWSCYTFHEKRKANREKVEKNKDSSLRRGIVVRNRKISRK